MKTLLFTQSCWALCTVPAQGQSEGVAWRTDYQAALAEAQKSGKLVLAHFWTESCGPCRLLEARVFNQPSVAMAVQSQYVPVKINANEHPELAEAYGVTRVPTDAVLAADGKLVKAFVSPGVPMEYVGKVTQLAGAYRAHQGSGYAVAAAAAPAQPASYNTPTDAQGKYKQVANAQQKYEPIASQASQPIQAPPQNRYAALAPQQQAPQQQAPQQQAPQQQAAGRYAAPAKVENRYADITPVQPTPNLKPDPAVAPQQSVVPKKAIAQVETPQLPPGSPPLGFEGYCPVTMKSEWRWTKGDTRWGAIHSGRTYLFSSAEAQKKFLATPDQFSPVLSGVDPVAAVDERRSVPGAREFAVEYKGRFYMFSSEKTLETFWKNPNGYAEGVQRVAALRAADAPMLR